MSEVKHSDVCRICLDNGAAVSLFESNMSTENYTQPFSKFQIITSLKISSTDDLPKLLCVECFKRLQDAYTLREQAIHSDLVLRNNTEFDDVFDDNVSVKCEDGSDNKNPEQMLNNVQQVNKLIESKMNDYNQRFNLKELTIQVDEIKIEMSEEQEDCKLTEEIFPAERRLRSGKKMLPLQKDAAFVVKNEFDVEMIIKNDDENDDEKDDESGKWKCDFEFCNKAYSTTFSLYAHKRKKHGLPAVKLRNTGDQQCEVCQRRFVVHSALRKHAYRKHQLRLPRRKRCKPCKKCGELVEMTLLKTHMSEKHGVALPRRRYNGGICYVCGRFIKNCLSSHVATHQYEKAECDVCKKVVNNKHYLVEHLKTHTERERPFQCDKCPKSFTNQRFLKRHYEAHSDTRNYICDICQRCFQKSEICKIHRLTHFGARPYACSLCDKTYTVKSNVKLHCKKVHPEVTSNVFTDYGYKVPLPELDEKNIVIIDKPRNYMRGKVVFSNESEH